MFFYVLFALRFALKKKKNNNNPPVVCGTAETQHAFLFLFPNIPDV